MPKLYFILFSFFFGGISYSQSVIFQPLQKDSLASDSISYTISGFLEINDSIDALRFDLVQIHSDSLQIVYSMSSEFNQDLSPTNNDLQFNSETGEFTVQCGVFNVPDLMVRLLFFRNEEKIYETYYQ